MATVSTSQNLTAVSYSAGENITIDSGATLTIDSTPATLPGSIICITSGKLSITNSSTTTPIIVTLSANSKDFQFEKNGQLEIRGAMINLTSSASGASSEAFDLSAAPYTGIPYPSYVEVETSVGSGVYEVWMVVPVAGVTVNWATTEFCAGTGYKAGNVFFWNATTRSLYVGDNTNGNKLTAGVKVRIPNIYIHSNSNNATPGQRTLVDLNPSGYFDAFSFTVFFTQRRFVVKKKLNLTENSSFFDKLQSFSTGNYILYCLKPLIL
jgi:hypothetical protein